MQNIYISASVDNFHSYIDRNYLLELVMCFTHDNRYAGDIYGIGSFRVDMLYFLYGVGQ